MKKLLALVLALVMSMSLVTISNADFKDADEISYKEAVEVMNAVGVIAGYDNGNFGAKDTLTRAQAAKIVAYLDLGQKVADAISASGAVFTDVPANAWYAGYVEYCAGAGYVAGVGDGKFDPDAKVTGIQFAKMLLCVLGFDAKLQGYVGSDYTIAIARDANKKDLYKGLNIVTSAALTREQAAQMAFNAVKALTVDYNDRGTDIDLGNIGSITVGASKYHDETTTLAAKLYKNDLVKGDASSVTDDLGRPAHTYTYKGKTVGTYADTPDYVVTATEDYTGGAVALYKDVIDEDYTASDSVATKYLNGKTYPNGAVKSGDVVEFYLNDNGVITNAVYIQYSLAKVTKVDTKVSKADKEDDVTAYITLKDVAGNSITGLSSVKIKDTNFAGFDYEKDDVILYVWDATNSKILASESAKSVEGKVTATKGSKVAVDGTYYETVGTAPALDAEGTFYLNAAGQIMGSKATVEESDNYAYVYSIVHENKRNNEGVKTDVYTVYFVKADGTKASANIDKDDLSDVTTNLTKVMNGTTVANYKGVIAYKLNSDGDFEYVAPDGEIETAVTLNGTQVVSKDNAVIASGINATSKTTFVFIDRTTDTSKVKVSTVDGYKNVKITAGATVVAVTDDDDYAQFVFVDTKNGNVAATGYIAVLVKPEAEVKKDDDNTYYTYEVYVDGELTTVTAKNDTKGTAVKTAIDAMAKGDVFSYNLEDGYVVEVNNETETGISFNRVKTVSAVNDDYVVIDGKQYDVSEGTLYTITKDYKKDGTTIDSITVVAGGEFDTDNKVTFTTDDGDLDVVFVIEEIK